MAGEIEVGVLCSDIESLGANEAEVRMFIYDHLAPALVNEIISRRQIYFDGFDSADPVKASPELRARACSIKGSMQIKF
ncbi:hypothetical protein [Oceanicoccus sagamiensis]|uniref:Uncharacterized protein n=1 Tax=Oceanicoccus sagamiensis TaxID=716816 RepID=A0A1X9ND87_9GAMM|nr:hypothetical protein [Oceanicoccus sagamiensis]ARN75121.1 hypothetical protein BST96_13955 [Oceanicoccus sagamiensis]